MDKLKNLIEAFKIPDNHENIFAELKYEVKLYLDVNCLKYVDIMNINITEAYNNLTLYNEPDQLLYIYILHYWNKYFLPKDKPKNYEFLFIKDVYHSVFD